MQTKVQGLSSIQQGLHYIPHIQFVLVCNIIVCIQLILSRQSIDESPRYVVLKTTPSQVSFEMLSIKLQEV